MSYPYQPPHDQKDDYTCNGDADDITSEPSSPVGRIEKRIGVEVLGRVRHICQSQIKRKKDDKQGYV